MPASPPERRDSGFAFFDLDHTILPFDTQALFCNYVLEHEPLRRAYVIPFLPAAAMAAVKLLDTRGLKRSYLSYLWNMPVKRLHEYCADFAKNVVRPAAYPEVVAEIDRHKAEGRLVVLNTASPDFYARAIAAEFDFDRYYPTPVDLDDEEWVPYRPPILGENNKRAAKLRRMADILPEHIDPEAPQPIPDSYGYSDSKADIPLLSLCPDENNTQVHPSKEFRAYGEERGWKVIHPERPYSNKLGDILTSGRLSLGLGRG